MGESKTIHKVAIIGGGPKGIYGFERLAAWLKLHRPSARAEIHIFNRTDSFGAGENYRVEQPSYLLMNNPAGEVNMWGDELPRPVVPQPRSFSEWCAHAETEQISPNDYASRAMTGRYLSQGFESILSNLPDSVACRYVAGEVVDVWEDSGKYGIAVDETGPENHHCPTNRYDHILLATGHPRHRQTNEASVFRSFAQAHENAGYIPCVYPAESVFADVPPNCSVAMKGIGLTFVDAVLALTEGKGGRFQRDGRTDELSYIPSGDEPAVIYPFSRSGLPMIPRRSMSNERNELRFFTRSALRNPESDKKLNFDRQIWPLLRQDLLFAYYDVAMKNAGFPDGLSCVDDFDEVARSITEFHGEYPQAPSFDAEEFLNPSQAADFQPGEPHHAYIESLYEDYLREARKGELRSPLAAATGVWRKASSLFCEVYSFGGLTPESQRHFDRSVRGKLNRVTFGPPVRSAEKIHALMTSGILNFEAARNPEVVLDEKSRSFVLESNPGGARYPVQFLVDARIPGVSLADSPGLLFTNLLRRGLVTLYENRLGEEVFQPGAINMTPQGFVIDKSGTVNRRIAVTGTPTEGITFDNDTLSRKRNNFVDGWAEFVAKQYARSTEEKYASRPESPDVSIADCPPRSMDGTGL